MDGGAFAGSAGGARSVQDARDALRVLIVASEAYPLAKTGGLGDVLGALPKALCSAGIDVRLMLPGYEEALDRAHGVEVVAELGSVCGVPGVRLLAGRTPDAGLPVWLVDCPALYRRGGTPYQDDAGADWPDNALRFGVFDQVVAWCAQAQGALGWQPQVVHCHDWQTGLVPLLLLRAPGRLRPGTVFTIHNAAFQGNFDPAIAARLGVGEEYLQVDGVEFFGRLSFLKGGVRFADALTTVSARYAREICTPEFGCGLHGLYAARAADLTGILNGIDVGLWDPAADPHLAARYSRDDLAGKCACKGDLQHRFGLPVDASRPLLAFLARLTTQKMADVVLECLPRLLQRHPDLQCIVCGRGERDFEAGFRALAARCPLRVAAHIGYTEEVAHGIHAGSDLLLHGARFEPCGLTQMHAMRYGSVPVVRSVGGLAETVVDPRDAGASRPATGFVFEEATAAAIDESVDRCLHTYRSSHPDWRDLQLHGMETDFGWERSARAYVDVYRAARPPGFARA